MYLIPGRVSRWALGGLLGLEARPPKAQDRLERPVDDREDRELAAFLDDVDQADLETVELLRHVDEPEHEPISVSRRVHKAPFESIEGTLLHVDAPELD